ncbi:molybdenum cofactor synthesis domain protein [Roseovarius mucosus DSM 17069]|uniref:Molybdopterin molybdenumtransferase n=1 Tax=Roseovarius mucosus DSM 17069 TaxID=1288298 RepID=A0A0A0HGN4_9RHOB|nr:gephyrin-like molybdotransferase Glp [Roseovarius mucosus]KGM86932.1 molybdenum cofactor synthesis domain protein [Roseovarius mucosus DSM 17069]
MTPFDTIAMLDWSGGGDTGPQPCKDAIWLGITRNGVDEAPSYLRNRAEAEAALVSLIEAEVAAGRRLLIGVDFPFGFPAGFARGLTGCDNPFAVWDWLETVIEDGPQANNRFDVAGEINRRFPGVGPFWFNGVKREIADLPRKDTRAGHGMVERRAAEAQAKGAFTCWQMGGAGAVGGQVLTGLPVLNRLRRRFYGQVSVWPFEVLDKPVALVEVWPGLINPAVKRAEAQGGIRDAHQVRLMARALARMSPDRLTEMLAVDAPEEGWILGLGHEAELIAACEDTLKPPPLRNDCFALPAGVDWTPVDDALALLRDRLRPVVGQSRAPLAQALGRVLATPITAPRANPPEANTAVDGYGFAHASLTTGDQVLPLVQGRAAAGVPYSGTVPPGYAIRVLTGAALPTGVDTVILQEDVTLDEGRIAFRSGLKPGANTRRAGEDVAAGAPVLEPGRVITPADLALCAAVGLSDLPIHDQLRVAVMSTGDELVEPGVSASDGQIYDANRPMLLGLMQQMGYAPLDLGRIGDDRAALRAAFDHASENADAILTSGGASAGDEDHVSALLNEAGAMAQWRIALKPGRPLALGLWRGVPVFGLPGNPVAALVCALIFARPALRLLSGAGWSMPQGLDVPAAFEKRKKPGRREYLRARIREGRVEVFASEGSGRISGLSWAEGLVELPDGAVTIQPGDPVRYIPYASFLSA